MCIIIVNPQEGETLDADVFNRCAKEHPDGMGMSWVDNGVVKTMKTLRRTDLLFTKYLDVRAEKCPVLLHFRKATEGDVRDNNCHPFWHRGMAFAHNGTVKHIAKIPEGMTDSETLATIVLEKLQDGWWNDDDLITMVGEYLGKSKIAMLSEEGKFYIVNPSEGNVSNGNWFSNYSWKEGWLVTRASHDYGYGSWRNDIRPKKEKGYTTKDHRASMTEKKLPKVPFKSHKTGHNFWDEDTQVLAYEYMGHHICTWCMPDSGQENALPVGFTKNAYSQCTSCLEFIYWDVSAREIDMTNVHQVTLCSETVYDSDSNKEFNAHD